MPPEAPEPMMRASKTLFDFKIVSAYFQEEL
jgi:hypothetical protein